MNLTKFLRTPFLQNTSGRLLLKKKIENNTDESDFSEKEILDLNSLKLFEFESKTNRVIDSSSSDDQKQPLVVVCKKGVLFCWVSIW